MEQTIFLYPSKGHADAVCERKGTYSLTPFSLLLKAIESLNSTYLCMHFFLAYLFLLGHPSSQSEPDTLTDNQRGLEGLCVRNLFDRSVPHVRTTTHVAHYLRKNYNNNGHQGERGQHIDYDVYLQILYLALLGNQYCKRQQRSSSRNGKRLCSTGILQMTIYPGSTPSK